MTTVRDRLREFTAKVQEHLDEADSYLTAIADLLNEDPAILSPHMQFREAWNTATKGTPIAACLKLTPGRIEKIKSRLTERPIHEWEAIFQRIASSNFCCGREPRGNGGTPWLASFDWLIHNADNGVKVMEGKYDNRPTREDLLAAVPDARGHIPPCRTNTECNRKLEREIEARRAQQAS